MTDNARSALFMTIAMAGFSVNDALTKLVAHDLGLFQTVFLRGLFAIVLVAVLVYRSRPVSFQFSGPDRRVIAMRLIGEIGGTICFLTALIHMPLANATAILQAIPLAVTIGAAIFFKETVGWRRYLAIAVGLIGMLFIIRPGAEDFNAYSLLAVAAVGFLVLRDLATRQLSAQVNSTAVTVITTIGIMGMGGFFSLSTPWPAVAGSDLLLLSVAALGLLLGYLFSILSMRTGEVGAVAPFRYSILLWAILLGMIIFDEWPDQPTLIGAALLTLSGLYTLHRERQLATDQTTQHKKGHN